MKKILEFDSPTDDEAFDVHNNAYKFFGALKDLRESYRNVVKYGDSQTTITYEQLFKEFWDILKDNDIEKFF